MPLPFEQAEHGAAVLGQASHSQGLVQAVVHSLAGPDGHLAHGGV